MPIKKKKISELKEALDLKGFFTIGYRMIDGVKESVKYGLEQIQNLYENLVKAISDAQEATTDMRQLETTVEANEEQRQITENQRGASEQERQASESERIASEYDRISAEDDRKSAEAERSTSESVRQEAEGVRDSAEAVRVTEFATLKQESDTATGIANAAAASANQAAIGANQAADNANEQAVLAATAADNANDTANHPTYIGQDHYVYKWNKEAQGYDKTDIYTKGNPGAPFQVDGWYVTLEELQTAIPDGSAVEGVMAVGENEPYDYYAQYAGEWQTQGRLQGVDGKSAYQIAVDNGFVGTMAEWLASLQGTIGIDGKPGTDGVSCTHSWNGTTLTVTSASGTSSTNLKGDKGDKGDTGAQGATGNSFLEGTITKYSTGIVGVSRIMVGNNGAGGSPGILLAVGDTDSGLHSTTDGTVLLYANSVNMGSWNSSAFYIYGSSHASGGFWKDSDRRLKSKITPLTHTLEQILSIPTDSFLMNGKEQIGTIAQEVEKICPEVVSESLVSKSEVPERGDWETIIQPGHDGKNEEYVKVKRVEYEMLGVLALEGVKLLKAKVDELKDELKRLKDGRD